MEPRRFPSCSITNDTRGVQVLRRTQITIATGRCVRHPDIFERALARLKAKVRYQPIGFELLPDKFTLTQLQQLYETILERKLDKWNFRKRILAMDVLRDLDEVQKDVSHRAARLYRFDRADYRRAVRDGFEFSM